MFLPIFCCCTTAGCDAAFTNNIETYINTYYGTSPSTQSQLSVFGTLGVKAAGAVFTQPTDPNPSSGSPQFSVKTASSYSANLNWETKASDQNGQIDVNTAIKGAYVVPASLRIIV